MEDSIETTVPWQIQLGKMLDATAGFLKSAIFPIVGYCAKFAAILIVVMGTLIGVDIFYRQVLGKPIPQVFEIEQILLSIVVFLGFAHTQTQKGHIQVDILSTKFNPKLALVIEGIVSLVGGFVFLIIGWEQVIKAQNAYILEEVFSVSQIPVYPLLILAATGCGLMLLVLLTDFIQVQAKIFNEMSSPVIWFLCILTITALMIFLPSIMKIFSVKTALFTAGILGVAFLMLLLLIGLNIGVAMGYVGLIGVWYLKNFTAAAMAVNMTIFDAATDYNLIVMPFFVGMGFLCFASGLSNELFSSALKIFGRLKGGLSIATIFGCAGFASICGDSMATAAAMGSVALPEMRKKQYDIGLATGSLAAGGALGILIPPSVGFIVYAIVTEQSIGKLFFAGIIPGIMLTGLFCLIVWFRCKMNPELGPAGPKTSFVEKIMAVIKIWPILILFLLVMGGLWFGIFTAPEAGGVGLIGTLVIGFVLRRYTLSSVFDALLQSVQVTSMIFAIYFGVLILGHFITASELPLRLVDLIQGLGFNRYIIFAFILFIYLILGCLMNIIPMMMLTLPVIYPTIISLGFDPIWFGVIMVIMMEMGQITPPMGLNVFVIHGIAKDVNMVDIFRGIFPFIIAQFILIIILTLFPDIVLYLPNSLQTLAPIID